MHKQKGFTLIELVIVIVVLGVLAAIVMPKYANVKTSALNAAKTGMSGVVKSALAIAIATTKDFPNVTALAGYVSGEGVNAVDNGVNVTIDGNAYTVPTYLTEDCNSSNLTNGVTSTVKCVGTIPLS